MRKSKMYRLNRKTIFDYFNILFLLVVSIITVYPVWSVLIITLNDPINTLGGRLWLLPREWTLNNYIYVFRDTPEILRAAFISVARTVLGALCTTMFTAAAAYAISKKNLRGRKFYIGLILAPMYIIGGMIPTFLLIRSIGLYQNFLVYIIPTLFSNYFAIIMYSNFKMIPRELEESVKVDGGNDLIVFFRIIIPISMPVMAAVVLFCAVTQWTSWFDTLLYGGQKLMTLQALLVTFIRDVEAATKLALKMNTTVDIFKFKPTVQSVEATCMMITAIPIIFIYPFMQKYFVKGLMIGSLKE